MRKNTLYILTIVIGILLFFGIKEIVYCSNVSRNVKILSSGEVYIPNRDEARCYNQHMSTYVIDEEGKAIPESKQRQEYVCRYCDSLYTKQYYDSIPQIKAFYFLMKEARLSTIYRLMDNCSPSIRVYAYFIYLSRTKDIRFDYIIKSLDRRSEVLFTASDRFISGRECFASDVMLFIAAKCPGSQIYGLLDPYHDDSYGLTSEQAKVLLEILSLKEPLDPIFHIEIVEQLNFIAGIDL